VQVTREFQPEPSKLIVRWTITWEGENGPGVANGSSTFRLNDDGLVAEAEDLWEVEGETGDGAYFGRCFEFALALRPGGMRKLQWESLNTAMKLAGWEALKNSPMYGGQMTREELDVLITQSMYAVGGCAICPISPLRCFARRPPYRATAGRDGYRHRRDRPWRARNPQASAVSSPGCF
jgi:hypothetical protein